MEHQSDVQSQSNEPRRSSTLTKAESFMTNDKIPSEPGGLLIAQPFSGLASFPAVHSVMNPYEGVLRSVDRSYLHRELHAMAAMTTAPRGKALLYDK
jgi:hypothetical protein